MKRFLYACVLVGTVAVGGFLAYSIWKASPRTAEEFLKSGKDYYQSQKYSEAVIQLLNAVRKDPGNREAHYLLALCYLRDRNPNMAAQQLSSLLEYYPDDVQASLELGKLYLSAGQTDPKFFQEVQKLAQNILSKDPKNVAAIVMMGNAAAGLQDYSTSLDLFGQALNLDPQNVSALVSLGTTEVLQKNYTDAEQFFLKAYQVDPKNKSALISLANYYRAAKEVDKAEAVFKEALAVDASDKAIYLEAAVFYYRLGRFADVENTFRAAQKKSPDNPEPALMLSDFYLSKNRLSDAQNLLAELKKQFPQNVDIAAKLAVSLMQDQPKRAQTEIDAIVQAEPKNPVGFVLLGELQFLSGKYDDAAATLNKFPATNSRFPEAHFFLGRIAALKNDLEQAQNQYQMSLVLNQNYIPARESLAEVFLKKGRLQDARVEAQKVLDIAPGSIQARLLKATLDTVDQKFADAQKEFALLIKEDPRNPLIHRQMALYFQSRGSTADAEKSLIAAADLQPQSQEALRDLVSFYISTKQTNSAVERINKTPDADKQSFHYELLGLVYSQAGKTSEAEAAYKRALERDPSRVSSDLYLASSYMQAGRLDDAIGELDRVIQKNPANASAYAAKGLIYERQEKLDKAKENFVQALKIDPAQVLAANDLAFILAEEGRDLESALNWAQTARKKEPENPNNADTLGWVQYKMGRNVLALDQLRFAVSKQPENPEFQYHLAMIYKEIKQTGDAETALKKALSSKANFKEKNLAESALKEIAKSKTGSKFSS